MNIIVDGCDGAGKTTLIDKLSDYYHCDVLHAAHKGSKLVEDYVDKYVLLKNMIFDRCFLSELVYSKVFNRKCELNELDVQYILNKIAQKKIPVIILDCDADIIRERLIQKNDYSEIISNIDFIREEYLKLAHRYNFTVVNTLKDSFDDIKRKIEA